MQTVDRNGVPLREGSAVRLVRADPALLRDLPPEDQQAIEWAKKEGKLLLVGHDAATGNLELEFVDPVGGTHWIFVSPQDVVAIH